MWVASLVWQERDRWFETAVENRVGRPGGGKPMQCHRWCKVYENRKENMKYSYKSSWRSKTNYKHHKPTTRPLITKANYKGITENWPDSRTTSSEDTP